MFCLCMDIRPAGPLSFRRFPGSILHIATYPFLPPSTMSGFLRRLLMMQNGGSGYPETSTGDAPFYVMPYPTYHVLGAYPDPLDAFYIHTTYRHGIRDFKHTAFSKILREKAVKQNYQLHTWEYLFVNKLKGYVVSDRLEALKVFQNLNNFGCKIGKEGFAFIENISDIIELKHITTKAIPSVLTPSKFLRGASAHIYFLYRHDHAEQISIKQLSQSVPNNVQGFKPLCAGLVVEPLELDFLSNGNIFIPSVLLEEI